MQMLDFINELGSNHESKMHAVLCQEKAIELLEVERSFMVKTFYDGVSKGYQEKNTNDKDVIEEKAIAFHKWMLKNDTSKNAERFFHFADSDMFEVFIEEVYNKNK